MKKFLFIGLLFTRFVYAQNFSYTNASIFVEPNILFNTNNLVEETNKYLARFVEPYQTLTLTDFKKSSIGFHLQFKHLYNHVEVFGSSIKVNITLNGNLINVVNTLQNFSNKPFYNISLNANETACWWVNNNFAVAAKQLKYKDELNVNMLSVFTNLPQPVFIQTLDLFNKQDSLVKTKLFNPDPLTTSQRHYGDSGGLYKNNNGSDNAVLNAERKLVNVNLVFDADTFYAKNKYVTILDMEAPFIAPFKTTNPNFDFTRANPEFRELMCLYHIEELNYYLNSLGLDSVMQNPTNVDASAYQGQDQSRFSVESFGPALYFGTGGVPDAEDADVIIHEYSHAIGYAISPNTTSGNQRLALEEANCDFMATQYSKVLSTFEWRNVFNWDGYNEFWNGRKTDTNKKYPDDVVSDFYKTAEIWSSMLNDIGEDIGRDAITKLVINSIYFYQSNITLQQAADFLLLTDSILFNYRNFEALKNRYIQRGFAVNYVGLEQENWFNKNLSVLNTQGFANGAGNAIFESNTANFTAVLTNINGQILNSFNSTIKLELNPNYFTEGVYFITFTNAFGSKSFKLIKH